MLDEINFAVRLQGISVSNKTLLKKVGKPIGVIL